MKFLQKNMLLIGLCFFYALLVLSVLDFGIPNLNHPFTYHMDEWHQLMAVRSLFKHGSSNVEGAANGPVFFFLQSGIFLGPFYVLKIIDPFAIKSSVSSLLQQERLFEILRLNTMLYGIGSIILVWEIAKKYLKTNPLIPTLFFICNPLWIMLSNYFKYDIALVFWILSSIYCLLWFSRRPTRRNYIIAGIFIGLALATKISAMPLLVSYFLAYYLFMPRQKQMIKDIFFGLLVVGSIFFLLGIPDSLFHAKVYYEFFYNNIISGPSETGNYILGMPTVLFMFFHIYPLLFGYGLYVLSIVSVLTILYCIFLRKKIKEQKVVYLLLLTFCVFVLSLVSLKIQATGNRVVVVLPFMVLFIGIFWEKLLQIKNTWVRKGCILTLCIILLIQGLFVSGWLQLKLKSNPREQASEWMKKNLPKQIIGLENIPIYQQIPDLALYEFYALQEDSKSNTHFMYEIINQDTEKFPKTIILTNVSYEKKVLKKSSKNELVARLEKEGYKEIKRFIPSGNIFNHLATVEDIPLSGLLPLIPISIYQK